MKILIYFGPNKNNVSGMSMMWYKVQRTGRQVQGWWGPALLHPKKRRAVQGAWIQTKIWRFRTDSEAVAFENKKIATLLKSGFARNPRRRSTY